MTDTTEAFDLAICSQQELRRPISEVTDGDLDELLVELGQQIEGWDPGQGSQALADLAADGDLERLLERLRRQLGEEIRRASARLFCCRAMALLLPHVDFEPPTEQVEQELTRMTQIAAEQGKQLSEHELETLMRPVVHRQLVEQQLFTRLALATGIRPDGPELTQAMESYARRYEMTREQLLSDGALAMEVANELYQELVVEAAFSEATIVEQPMTRAELVDELRRALLAKTGTGKGSPPP
jgi:FKBP-type peptidyl-prolyl cis-trans isomerase (trigger factor)